jgi:hypothetical protein
MAMLEVARFMPLSSLALTERSAIKISRPFD